MERFKLGPQCTLTHTLTMDQLKVHLIGTLRMPQFKKKTQEQTRAWIKGLVSDSNKDPNTEIPTLPKKYPNTYLIWVVISLAMLPSIGVWGWE